jgi:hypothetical protein
VAAGDSLLLTIDTLSSLISDQWTNKKKARNKHRKKMRKMAQDAKKRREKKARKEGAKKRREARQKDAKARGAKIRLSHSFPTDKAFYTPMITDNGNPRFL